MRWEQKVQYATISDIGMRRKNNQDSATVQLCADHEIWSQYDWLSNWKSNGKPISMVWKPESKTSTTPDDN